MGHIVSQSFAVVDDLHGSAAEHEGGPHDNGVADVLREPERLAGARGRVARRGRGRPRAARPAALRAAHPHPLAVRRGGQALAGLSPEGAARLAAAHLRVVVLAAAVDELLARCRALLRRGSTASVAAVMRVGDLVLNPMTREVTRGDRVVNLTKTEFDLLEMLMQKRDLIEKREVH